MKFTWKSILIIVVAFLAISVLLFIYTTKISSPVVMDLKIPKDNQQDGINEDHPSKLTLLLLPNDKVYRYFGSDMKNGRHVEIKDTRAVINEGIQKFTKDSFVILIKASDAATYKNTIDILDEIANNGISRYKIVELNKEEKEFTKKS